MIVQGKCADVIAAGRVGDVGWDRFQRKPCGRRGSFANWFISPHNRAMLLRCAVGGQSGPSEAKAPNENVRSGTRNLNEEALRWRAVKVMIAIDHILTNVAIGYGFLTIEPRRHPLTSHKCAQNMGCCRREMSLSTRQEWRSAADKSNLKIAGLRETFTAESQ